MGEKTPTPEGFLSKLGPPAAELVTAPDGAGGAPNVPVPVAVEFPVASEEVDVCPLDEGFDVVDTASCALVFNSDPKNKRATIAIREMAMLECFISLLPFP